MRSIAHKLWFGGQAIAVLDQAVVSATSFATNLIVARACGRPEFDVYILAVSLLHFVKGIQEQLVSAPYAVYSHRYESSDALERYTGSNVVHCLISSVALMLFVLSVRGTLHLGRDPGPLATALAVLLIVAPFFLGREYLRRLSFARFGFATALFMDTAAGLCQLAGVIVLFQSGSLHVFSTLAMIGAASALAILIWFLRPRIQWRISLADTVPDWLQNWGFARWALFTFVIGCSTPFVMPWIVAWLMGEGAAGEYGICQTLAGVANMFIVGIGNVLSPWSARAYARGGADELWPVLLKACWLFTLFLGAMCLLVLVIGESLSDALFQGKYPGITGPLFLLSAAHLAGALGMVAGNGLWALDEPRRNVPADLLTLVATLGSAAVFIPRLGVLGASLAVLVGVVLGSVFRWRALAGQISCHARLASGASG